MENFILEAFPDTIQARLELRQSGRNIPTRRSPAAFAFELVLDDLKLWTYGTLTVSFKGGSNERCGEIAEVAKVWTDTGGISFDFIDSETGNYRQWRVGDMSHIRVGFDEQGYWSLVGTDAADTSIAAPGEITLNLEGFDRTLPEGWASTVLHEFGHALGFHHEHQSPEAKCEFDFEKLYDYLAMPPNEWPKWKVDHNLRQLPAAGLTYSKHDIDSIMHYTFPEWMFKKGRQSPCFASRNNVLSQADIEMMLVAYPNKKSDVLSNINRRQSDVKSILKVEGLQSGDKMFFQKYDSFLESAAKNIGI